VSVSKKETPPEVRAGESQVWRIWLRSRRRREWRNWTTHASPPMHVNSAAAISLWQPRLGEPALRNFNSVYDCRGSSRKTGGALVKLQDSAAPPRWAKVKSRKQSSIMTVLLDRLNLQKRSQRSHLSDQCECCLGLTDHHANGIIAKRITELAIAGERNPDRLCEGALEKLRGHLFGD
jgi:hypothetical protein